MNFLKDENHNLIFVYVKTTKRIHNLDGVFRINSYFPSNSEIYNYKTKSV